jgi:hypothetical protein
MCPYSIIKLLGIFGQIFSVSGVIIFFLTGNIIIKSPRRNLVDLVIPFLLPKDQYDNSSEIEYKKKRVRFLFSVISIFLFLSGSLMLIIKEFIS